MTDHTDPQDHKNVEEGETVPTELIPEGSPAPVPQAPTPTPTPTPTPAQAPTIVAPTRPRVVRWLIPALALVAVALIALFGGILIGQHTGGPYRTAAFDRPSMHGGQSPHREHGMRGTGPSGGVGSQGGPARQGGATSPGISRGLATGTIQSITGDTISLKLRDGSTVAVTTSSSTTVTKAATSSVSELKAGENITVRGANDGSGNVAATSVSEGVRPPVGALPGAQG